MILCRSYQKFTHEKCFVIFLSRPIHAHASEGFFTGKMMLQGWAKFENWLHVLYKLENLIFVQSLSLCGMKVDLRI